MAWVALLALPLARATDGQFVYEREALDRSGLLTLAEFLERQPWAGSGQSPRLNGGGIGTHTVDVGDLGDVRTEVRVDGLRWIEEPDGSSDFGAIPIASVARIVVRRGGAATGGTIDITLRAPAAGFEVRSGIGEFTAGDGRRELYDMRLGAANERGGALLEASYAMQDGLLGADRAVSSVPLPGFDPNDVRAGASSTTPFGRFRFFVPGAPVPPDRVLIPGRAGNSTSDFRPYDARVDGFNAAAGGNLLAPVEQTALRAAGNYALFDGVTARFSALASERRSEQRLALALVLLGLASPDSILRAVDLAASAYNPYRSPVRLAQFRPSDEDRVFAQDTDTVVFDAGLDGELSLLDRTWHWRLGWRDADRERADITTGFFDNARLALGLGPSFRAADGVVRCGTAQSPIADCVPINVLGGPGGFTAAMRDYAGVVLQSSLASSQTQYLAGIDGALTELPAGPLALTLEVEHRRESGQYTPDALIAARGTDANGAWGDLPFGGRFASDHVDLALQAPLLRDLAFAHALDLDLGATWLDDDDIGSQASPRVTLRWAPVQDLAVRAAWTRSLRAPSLLERFDAARISLDAVQDPCFGVNYAPDLRRRCTEGFAGVTPTPVGWDGDGGAYAQLGGGLAEGMHAERATQRALGLAWTTGGPWSPWVDLGWSRQVIDNPIGAPNPLEVLEGCYIVANPERCRFISRGPSGEVERLFAGWQNLPIGRETETWDLGFGFGHDTDVGRFDLRADASYLSYLGEAGRPQFGERLADGSFAVGNIAGVFHGDLAIAPRLRARLALDWRDGDWSATLGYGWRSSLIEDCSSVVSIANGIGDPARAAALCSDPEGTPRFPGGANRIAAHGTADLALRWATPWNGRIALGILNLFDRDPPVSYASGNGNLLVIDPLPGRAWSIVYDQAF